MVQHNNYYKKLNNLMNEKKDSIFEPCRIRSFDPAKFTASVYGMRSNQVKENVLVLFPSLFLNSGVISFPVKNSTGILFVGADNESYLFPAQFLPPTREVTNGTNQSNSSPGQYDKLMNLEHMEPGEQLIRALTGSYLFIKNSGEVELATSKLHRLALNEMDGSLETAVEKERKHVGNVSYYNGPYEGPLDEDETQKDKHHIKMKFAEYVPRWESDDVLSEIDLFKILEADHPEDFVKDEAVEDTFELQMSNVFSEVDGTELTSEVDGEKLFLDMKVKKDLQTRLHATVSKSGAVQIRTESATGDSSGEIQFSDKKIGMSLEQQGNQYTMEVSEGGFSVKSQTENSAGLRIANDGDVKVEVGGAEYSFKEVVERLNQLSLLSQLEKL